MSKLTTLSVRIEDLKMIWLRIKELADKLLNLEDINLIQPELSELWQRWYRGSRELMIQNNFSGIEDFDRCYNWLLKKDPNSKFQLTAFECIEHFILYWLNTHTYKSEWLNRNLTEREECYSLFIKFLAQANGLLWSLVDEIQSRELPIKAQLSFNLVSDEFDTAKYILTQNNSIESLIRAAGTITRVWLERFLITIIESRNLTVIKNPPTKKKPESSDYIETLNKNWIITALQKSKLEYLFKIWNNCAHPKEVIIYSDVEEMIKESKLITALIA